jgi:DNA helicase-2/ATP-dependent DNA helicase PcrA
MQDTLEQLAIYDWVRYDDGNLVIRARAGAGKTTTLINLSKLLNQTKSATFLAYNKHIQEELKGKQAKQILSSKVFIYTSHGLGYSAIKRKYKDAEIDEFKADKVIARNIRKWDMSQVANPIEYVGNLKKMVDLIRLTLTFDKMKVIDLADKHDMKFDLEDTSRAFLVLEEMLNDKKTIDFTDMVYLPVVDKKIWMFPQDYVLIDEAQDLCRAQHEMIKKLVKWDKATNQPTTRLIFCGDDLQAIYGFTGADTNSFENLTRFPNTKVLPLTISFRCAKNIIKEANKIVPDIRAREDAEDGIVRTGSAIDEATDGDFILARKTLPLVRLFFNFLVMKKKATIKGSDFGINLIHMIEDANSLGQLGAKLTNNLNAFREKLERSGVFNANEHTGYVMLSDKIEVLKFLMKMVNTVDELKQAILGIFRDNVSDGITLSTVHKAKGLEADRVFIVRPDEMPMGVSKGWMYQQEMNLKYIAITRAKRELVYDVEWREDHVHESVTETGLTKTNKSKMERVSMGD